MSEKAELRRIANLLGLLLVRELRTDGDKAHMLAGAGFTNGHIASLLNIAPTTVAARLSERTGKKKRGGKKRGSE